MRILFRYAIVTVVMLVTNSLLSAQTLVQLNDVLNSNVSVDSVKHLYIDLRTCSKKSIRNLNRKGNLSQLTTLVIAAPDSFNGRFWLDKNLLNATDTIKISVGQTALNKIFSAFRKGKSLTRSVIIYHSKISSVPPEIGHLGSLEHLSVTNTMIKSIPEQLVLTSLKEIDISNNPKLEIEHCLQILKNINEIERVVARNCGLKDFPKTIINLKALKELDLGQNSFTVVPDSICLLKRLELLDLSRSNIDSIPDCLIHNLNLKLLNLWGTKMTFEKVEELKAKREDLMIMYYQKR